MHGEKNDTSAKKPYDKGTSHCDPDCKYGGAETKNGKSLVMIRCCFCMHWFHEDCMKRKNENTDHVWNCFTCRTMPVQITNLIQHVTDLANSLKEMKDAHQESKAESVALKYEIAELKSKMETMTASSTYSSVASSIKAQTPPKKETLLIGDSIIRDVDESKLLNTKVKCLRGATVKDVHEEMLKEKREQPHKKVVVVVGTNDCAKDDVSVSDIVNQYGSLVTAARTLADEVIISSICPRLDQQPDEDRCSALNAGLQGLCEDKKCSFVDHTQSFTLADGTVNEGFLLGKGPHLTRSGTNRLARNLKLSIIGDDVTTPRFDKNTSSQKHHHVSSNGNNRRGCYNCGERNHITKNCRHDGPITCTSCKRKGHKAKFCRQR